MGQSGCMLHWFSFDLSISWYSTRVIFYLDWIGVGSLVKCHSFQVLRIDFQLGVVPMQHNNGAHVML